MGIINLNKLTSKEWNLVMGIARTGIIGLYDLIEILGHTDTGLSEEETETLVRKLTEAPVTKFKDLR